MSNIDAALVGATFGGPREGMDRTGQRCTTYELGEALLRHLRGDGIRGDVRLTLVLDDAAWTRYRTEVRRPFRGEPSVVVVPVAGVGTMEFRRQGQEGTPGVVATTERPGLSWSEGSALCPHCVETDCNGRECQEQA